MRGCKRAVAIGLCMVLFGAPARAGTGIDAFDDFFSASTLDPSWTPDASLGPNSTFSLTDRPGFLRVAVPGNASQPPDGEVLTFLRSGPDDGTYPEWWAVLRFEHNVAGGSNNGGVGFFLAGLDGFLSPERIGNSGFDGVFVGNGGMDGDQTPRAQSNPTLLAINKRADGSLFVWYKDDASPHWQPLFNNNFDMFTVTGTLSPDVNLLVDARASAIDGGVSTGDLLVDIDYIDFSEAPPPGIGADYLDDDFDGTVLDPSWTPDISGFNATWQVTGGFLQVDLLGSLTLFPGGVQMFIRPGPPSSVFPRWIADIKIDHEISPSTFGAAAVAMFGPAGFRAPKRIANGGFNGVFTDGGPFPNGSDSCGAAQADPIILRVEKTQLDEFYVDFRADGDPQITWGFDDNNGVNPFDGTQIIGFDFNLLADTRQFVIGGNTVDQTMKYDYVDFSVPTPGDRDLNDSLDLWDWAWFQACYTGPGLIYAARCESMDLDFDFDVDGDDHALFVDSATGPTGPVLPVPAVCNPPPP
ncbi:MAG: hypothetical protein GY778_23695 [bacterium]|nr:hypothetical protein [bacterium]